MTTAVWSATHNQVAKSVDWPMETVASISPEKVFSYIKVSAYYWIEKENILIEVVWNPAKKGFFSVGKQDQPQDYFEGTFYQVKP